MKYTLGWMECRRRLGWVGSVAMVLWLVLLLFARAARTNLRLGWIFPTEHLFEDLSSFWVPLAFVLGLAYFGLDRLAGVREFLLHRGITRRRLAGSRVATGLALLCGVLAAGVWLPGPLRALFDRNGAQLSPAMVLRSVLLSTSAFAAFGAGAFTATLRAPLAARAVLGAASFTGVAWGAHILVSPLPDAWSRSWLVYVGVQALWTLLFLRAAHAGALADHDLDRPLERERLHREGLAAAASFFALTVVFGPSVQEIWQRKVVASQPEIVATAEGLVLVQRASGGGSDVVLDRDLRPDPTRAHLVEDGRIVGETVFSCTSMTRRSSARTGRQRATTTRGCDPSSFAPRGVCGRFGSSPEM